MSLFSFHDSIDRTTWWLTQIALVPIYLIIIFLPELLQFFLLIPLIWVAIAANAKRLHDREKSGWYQLLFLIPIAGTIWGIIELGFLGPRYNQRRKQVRRSLVDSQDLHDAAKRPRI